MVVGGGWGGGSYTEGHSKPLNDEAHIQMQCMDFVRDNRPIRAKCVASAINCGLGLETVVAPAIDQEMATFH